MNYICVLDFEATCWEPMTGMFHEIIEFPSVLVEWNKDTKEKRIIDTIQLYCKPKVNQILSDFCTELTGITQDKIDSGISFTDALIAHKSWLEKNLGEIDKLVEEGRLLILTCGSWDLVHCAPGEFRRHDIHFPHKLYTQFINIKTDFEKFYGYNGGGMKSMLGKLNLSLDGRHHSGIDDCKNITKILFKMIDDGYKEPSIKYSGFKPKKKYLKALKKLKN